MYFVSVNIIKSNAAQGELGGNLRRRNNNELRIHGTATRN
jgi:hypothetical protein